MPVWAHALDCPATTFLSSHRGQMRVLECLHLHGFLSVRCTCLVDTSCSHQLMRGMSFLLVKLHSAGYKLDLGHAVGPKERESWGWNLAECGHAPCSCHWPLVEAEVEGRKTWTWSWMVCWGQECQPEQRHVLCSGNSLRDRSFWARLADQSSDLHRR